MTQVDILFGLFGAITVLPVVYMLFTKDIIRAAFALVLTLLGLAALFVLLHAEYMAVVQILIYAGGVIVLLIFGVMLTKRISDEGVFTGHRNVVLSVLVALVLLGVLVKLIAVSGLEWSGEAGAAGDQVKLLGQSFLTTHLVAFELVAFVLLVALVGAAFLAKKSNNI